ncbi:hypothetical protein PCCS19_32800 [Paenibacillus sp. CCS19]|uniref:DUF3995 domain-containing protein n=1 Tax=Paenibacillus sp. CCS19 TaxID=3158387 RepID=UPI002560138F|nr:DUF3995 domain-containing protein [Paenibacillus cellulosilyticus]GMK40225.1 hypothetical protein PCCS19_32800 [Paenibacillus cellulosilyticus]
MEIIVVAAAVMLLIVSGFHLFWAFGGRWGGGAAVPEKMGGGLAFKPGPVETAAVALLILAACYFLLAEGELLSALHTNALTEWGSILCAAVFGIRTVGDFRYVGFFKRCKQSRFAKYDTWFYSPLCLFLAAAFVVALQ